MQNAAKQNGKYRGEGKLQGGYTAVQFMFGVPGKQRLDRRDHLKLSRPRIV